MNELIKALFIVNNAEHLDILKKMSIYYRYGINYGKKLENTKYQLDYKKIIEFLDEMEESKTILLNYFIKNGLSLSESMVEFCPSLFFTFKETNLIPNITSVVEYQTTCNKYLTEIIGTMTKHGISIQSNFDFKISNYTTIINNFIFDLLKKYSKNESKIGAEYDIKFAKENNLNFYSGFAIKNNSPLREYIVYNFMKYVDNINNNYESCIFETRDEYVLGYVKKTKNTLD